MMFAIGKGNPEAGEDNVQMKYGAMLSIGLAAGVALMGTARGVYTFGAHLKWTPVIALGYGLSILVHLWLNSSLMHVVK